MEALRTADTRTLYRAFDRLRRSSASTGYWGCISYEERALVLIQMGEELQRRGWHDDSSLWSGISEYSPLDLWTLCRWVDQRDRR